MCSCKEVENKGSVLGNDLHEIQMTEQGQDFLLTGQDKAVDDGKNAIYFFFQKGGGEILSIQDDA